MIDPIPASDLTALDTVPADDRHELGVAPRVSECRNHGDLCNMSKADDSVSDRSLFCHHLVSSAAEWVTLNSASLTKTTLPSA
jgi:hypothetical protein